MHNVSYRTIYPQEKIRIVKVNVGLYISLILFLFFHMLYHKLLILLLIAILRIITCNYRMGHPSHERLTVLRNQYPFITINKLHICDTCNCGKQKNLPFVLRTFVIVVIFDILHLDIWGPCSVPSRLRALTRSQSQIHGGIPQGTQGRKVNRSTARGIAQEETSTSRDIA